MPATPIAACDATTVTLPDGRVVLSFGGCNYLGLANHPRVLRAVAEATVRYGLSTTASRETTGNTEPHDALERELAAFLGVEKTLLMPDGYLANIAACQGFKTAGYGYAVLDSRAHASMTDAALAAGLRVAIFDHGDTDSLAGVLDATRQHGGRDAHPTGELAVVMTDGVFTADGEPAQLAALLDTLGPHDRLLVDDCHGLGVLGPGGRGSVAHAGLTDHRVVITSSLAKGMGCAGGVIAGTASQIQRCTHATAYVCTTPVSPAMAEGTRAALAVLISEPTRIDRLALNAERLQSGLVELDLLPTLGRSRTPRNHTSPTHTPVAAFTLGDLATMERLATDLLADGFRVPLIRYPGGPAKAYFRLSVNAEHTPEQIDQLLTAFAALLELTTISYCPMRASISTGSN